MKKLLLDECVPQQLREHFTGAEVYTVSYMQWDGIRNGKLLTLASENGFEVFVTTDKNLPYQQNIGKYKIVVVVLNAPLAKMKFLIPLARKATEQLNSFEPGKIYEVN